MPPDVLLTVGQAAARLGARPVDLTMLFYRRELRDDICPLVGGRRLIPPDYLAEVERVLRRRGKPCRGLAPLAGAHAATVTDGGEDLIL